MSIIKERLKFNNADINLKINLSVDNNLIGYQQEIDILTEKTKQELINPIIDNEVRRFSYAINEILNPTYLVFYFTANGSSYNNSFRSNGAGFTDTEINSNNLKIFNSFFIMDFYDSYDSRTQTKIFTNYLTKITGGLTTGSGTSKYSIPKYKIFNDTVNQYYNWTIPKSYLDEQTSRYIIGYVKFSFYNAKYGTLALFYNKDISDQYSPDRMYFKVRLDKTNMTWRFYYAGTNYPYNMTAYQLPFTNKYSERANDAMKNFDNLKQVPPTGNIFQITNGTYTKE